MKEIKSIFTCDLCGSKEQTSNDKRPSLWVTLEIDHPDTDRVIAEKHICDECCLTIKKLHEKA